MRDKMRDEEGGDEGTFNGDRLLGTTLITTSIMEKKLPHLEEFLERLMVTGWWESRHLLTRTWMRPKYIMKIRLSYPR